MLVVHSKKRSGEPATAEDIDAVKRNQRWKKQHADVKQPVTAEPAAAGDVGTSAVDDDAESTTVQFVAVDDDEEDSDSEDETNTTTSANIQQHIRAAVSQRPIGRAPGGKPRKQFWQDPREVPGTELLAAMRDLPDESADDIATHMARHLELTEKQVRRVRRRLADMLAARQDAFNDVTKCFVAGNSADQVVDAIRTVLDREWRRPARRPFDV